MRVTSKRGHLKLLRRHIQHIYPLDVHCSPPVQPKADNMATTEGDIQEPDCEEHALRDATDKRPVRRAATQPRDQIIECLVED